jgi:predicted signal transduction protein with EAL and GGDEF domain
MKYRLITFFSATAFLALMGAVLFLIAGTLALPSIWLSLGLRLLFTLACALTLSDDVARERLEPRFPSLAAGSGRGRHAGRLCAGGLGIGA